jgi:hypothetical protein
MIAVVVPTIRPEQYDKFLKAWQPLFDKHNVTLYKVEDGETPTVNGNHVAEVMGEYSDLIYNFNDGVRNLGFAAAYKDGAGVIITFDDDTEPFGDTIQDHLDVLGKKYPTSWINTANEVYMRGFPYGIREESECVLSHGVWNGVADFDASTQLVLGSPKLTYKQLVVPKGILYPMCIMNVGFARKMTPFMYQAPMGKSVGLDRFADIWGGIEAKKDIDANGWAAVTGFAMVNHNRASNPFTNLVKEAKGVGLNEKYGEDDYFKLFQEKRTRWQEFIGGL